MLITSSGCTVGARASISSVLGLLELATFTELKRQDKRSSATFNKDREEQCNRWANAYLHNGFKKLARASFFIIALLLVFCS